MSLYLKNKKVYLSGPLEFATGNCDWWGTVKQSLEDKFDLIVHSPYHDPKQIKWGREITEALTEKNEDKLHNIAKRIVRHDLGTVDQCDLLIANVTQNVRTTGTCHEIIDSNAHKKPVMLVCDGNRFKVPLWYRGFI